MSTLFAIRDGFRFQITVIRNPTHGFLATVKINGRLQSYTGKTPADAFMALTSALPPVVRRMAAERAEAEMQAFQGA